MIRLPWGRRAPETRDPLIFLKEIAEARQAKAEAELSMWRGRAESSAAQVLVHQEHASAIGKRYDDLLARYHMLKLQGFAEPAPQPVPFPRQAIDPITAAVNTASAGKDPEIRAAMMMQVGRDRNAGLKDDEIIRRIQRGNRPAEEVGV